MKAEEDRPWAERTADRFIAFSLDNPVLMVMIILGLLIGGYRALGEVTVDAIPDIGEKQVIVYTDWPGRSPQDVDDQVTYPLTTSLTGTPGVKTIRSMSGFGFSMIFVIFRDEVDYYWARSRVLERMNVAQQRLPQGVAPVLGPDATALGQIYWYTVEGEGFDLGELRSLQDWYIRYQLNAVEGVSEVAGVGGFVKQYQIDVHPQAMRAHRVSLFDIYDAVRRSNIDVGAKVLEKNGVEFFIRGVGFVKSTKDLENIVIRQERGTPLYVKNVAAVSLGPDFRRGALDKGGVEAVGGVVVMRYGENPRRVMERVQAKLKQIEAGLPSRTLPDGRISRVRIVPFYDRTEIVEETIDNLRVVLVEEAVVAFLVILFFLLHFRSTIATLLTLPLSIATCFLLMWYFGIDANVMSLAGLAIAIGDVADMGIIMTENIYRRIAARTGETDHRTEVFEAASEVGGAIFTAVSNTLVSFIPVFFLEDQEGKLFRPLAFTKTFAIGASVILAITVVPFMCYLLFVPTEISRRWARVFSLAVAMLAATASWFVLDVTYGTSGAHLPLYAALIGIGVYFALGRMFREKFLPMEENWTSRWILALYEPSLRWVLDNKRTFLIAPVILLVTGITIWLGIGFVLHPLEMVVNRVLPREKGRPRLELSYARWQLVEEGGVRRRRVLLRRLDETEKAAEVASGLRVVSEGRILPGLGREFMPPLDEGSFLYMPSLLPQGGLTQAVEVNGRQDLAIATVPEVESVVGKLGRADSALDPAPIGMFETVIILKPMEDWRQVEQPRWFSGFPFFVRRPLSWIFPEERRITKDEILAEIQEKSAIPGVLPTFLQPIQARLIMLQTGFRAMMGIKVYGSDLKEIEKLCLQMENVLHHVPGLTDIVADRIVGKPYIQFDIDRERIARYDVDIRAVQDVIEVAIGGLNLTESVEGRERYPIRVRYARDFREDLAELEKILVPTSTHATIPLAQLLTIRTVTGPQEIKGERGLLVGYVTMNTRDMDEVSAVEQGEAALQAALTDGRLKLPAGYYWEWGGQFENQRRAMERMRVLVPACLFLMFLMLYLGFRRWWIALIIYFGVIVSASGGFILLALWGVNLSVAVWVGFLVLFGVVDDDGVVMATYLEDVFEGREFQSVQEIREAVVIAGLRRIRPCLMTLATTVVGLMPVFWATGRGSDVMQPMAIPSVGGMAVSIITVFIVPCLFSLVEERKWLSQRVTPITP